jgi:hypothetical protein
MKKIFLLPLCFILWSFTLSDNPLEKYLTRITDPDIIKRDLATLTVWNSNPKKESDQKITPQSQWELLYLWAPLEIPSQGKPFWTLQHHPIKRR